VTSLLGLLFLAATSTPPETVVDEPGSVDDPEADTDADEPLPATNPQHDALEHLERAQELEAAGDLDSAEAEVSTAISLQPEDAPPYLVRAQILMALAERAAGDASAARRARAALLRLAARDVDAYIEHAELPSDGVAWFEARRQALLRDAQALDPPTPRPVVVEPEPVVPVVIPSPGDRDFDPRRRTITLVTTGALNGAAAVGLAAASLHIEQRCSADALCGARWQAQPSLLAPAAVLAALGTTSVVLGIASAPGLDRSRPRRAVIGSTVALGSAAVLLGTITGALASARWSAPVSPSNDAALGTTQVLGNVSVASFTAALPLLSAGLTAWIRGRIARPSDRMARRNGR
jgi:hypothetical protein